MRQYSTSSVFRVLCLFGLPLSLSLGGVACSSSTTDPGAGAAAGAATAGASSLPGVAGAPTSAGGAPVSGGSGAPAVVGGGGTDTSGAGAPANGGSGTGGVSTMAGSGGASAGSAGAHAQGGSGGSVGVAGAAGSGPSGGASAHNELVLYDDNGGNLLYVNNAKPTANWTTKSGTGRDLQLIGGGLVMLGKSDGWDEYRLSDGMKTGGQHGLAGTQAVHRLADGTTTVLATVSGTSIVLKLVNATGQMQSTITYPGFSYVRLVRPTSTGTYMVAADTVIFEGDATGKVLSQIPIPGGRHTWKAMRLANGNTAVTSGYGATLLVFDPAGKMLVTMGGKSQPMAAAIAPEFYADFHVMPNGNFFVVNSQADRVMDNSIQLLEYNPAGTLVWQQKQPTGIHSVEEAIVLDGLDTTKLQIEPQGQLISAP